MTREMPLAIADAFRFPLVGEAHPLRRRYRQALVRAVGIASLAHMTVFTVTFLIESRADAPRPPVHVIVIDQGRFRPPPPIAPHPDVPVLPNIVLPPSTPGVPVPVEDMFAPDGSIATQEELSRPLPSDLTNLLPGENDSVIVVPAAAPPEESGSPDDFVAYEEPPILIRLPAPAYPDMARQAEVEGTVVVFALVGKDGKIADARVGDGIPMLNDAALRAARGALFKPALQQHKPVEVWVRIPMEFRLQ